MPTDAPETDEEREALEEAELNRAWAEGVPQPKEDEDE